MSNSIGPVPYKKKYFMKNENSTHEAVTVYLPKEVIRALKEIALEEQLPLSRLVNYAIDHEFDQKFPFRYDTSMPETKYIKHAYVEEAAMLLEFLRKHPKGTELDALVLLRVHIGIPDKLTFMCAYRELLGADQVEHISRGQNPNGFKHAENTTFIVAKKDPVTEFARPKLKHEIIEENEKLKQELAKLKEQQRIKK